jgi:hypothetical protein
VYPPDKDDVRHVSRQSIAQQSGPYGSPSADYG